MGRGDIEAGQNLYPDMQESPELRWRFIRKVYTIISIQLLFTAAFASVFIFYQPARDFAKFSPYRFYVLFGSVIITILLLFFMSSFYDKHPVNLVFLAFFTMGMSVTVGYACAFSKGIIVAEAAFLTGVVVLCLTLYTFWAVKRGADFSFLGPFLFASMMVMFLFAMIQLFFPLGPLGRMIYAAVGALVMCGFIVHDTSDLIKNYSYDEYIWASIVIYGNIVNLFINLLELMDD